MPKYHVTIQVGKYESYEIDAADMEMAAQLIKQVYNGRPQSNVRFLNISTENMFNLIQVRECDSNIVEEFTCE